MAEQQSELNSATEKSEKIEVAIKNDKGSRKSAMDFKKYTKQIWLAGLGAFSRAEEEGNKLFDSLVEVGQELESRTIDATDQAVNRVSVKTRESVTETKDKVEKLLDQSVSHSLNRIGLVTVKDVQYLEALILQLHTKIDGLLNENEKLRDRVEKLEK